MIKLDDMLGNNTALRGLIFYLADKNSWNHNCDCLIEEIIELELVTQVEYVNEDFPVRLAEETADVLINMCVVNEMFSHEDKFLCNIGENSATGFILIKELTKFNRKGKYSPSFWLAFERYLSYVISLIEQYNMKPAVLDWMGRKTDRYWKRHNNGEDTN